MDLTPMLLLIILLIPNGGISSDVSRIEAFDSPERSEPVPEERFPSCDLTDKLCDFNCCSDKDCSTWERNSFNCESKNKDNAEKEITDLSDKECSYRKTDPIMCLHHSNSPYLGRFYLEPPVEEAINIKQKTPHFKPRKVNNQLLPTKKESYQVPTNVLGKTGFCLPRPIKIPYNTRSNCLYTISEETCLSNQWLRVNNYFSSESFPAYDNLNNISLATEVKCLNNGSSYVSLSRNIFHNRIVLKSGKEVTCKESLETTLNTVQHMCNNVVVGLEYSFDLSRSISRGKLTILTTNIPTNLDSLAKSINQSYIPFDDFSQPFLYVRQQVKIYFNGVNAQFQQKSHFNY